MSRLASENYLGNAYTRSSQSTMVRKIDEQVNALSEGRISARYQAQTSVPTVGAYAQGDRVENSQPSELTSGGNSYVVLGWICTVGGDPATFEEIRSYTSISAGGGGSSWTSTEVDFGTTPTYSATFTVTDASVSGTSKIVAVPDGSVATGRVGNDWEWDGIIFACVPGTGQFTLTGLATPGPIVGKRKVFYQVGA